VHALYIFDIDLNLTITYRHHQNYQSLTCPPLGHLCTSSVHGGSYSCTYFKWLLFCMVHFFLSDKLQPHWVSQIADSTSYQLQLAVMVSWQHCTVASAAWVTSSTLYTLAISEMKRLFIFIYSYSYIYCRLGIFRW